MFCRTGLLAVYLIGCLTSPMRAQQPTARDSREAAPLPAVAGFPPMAEIELTLAEWSTRPGDAGGDPLEELVGSGQEVAERVAVLEKARKLTVVERFRLTTVEGTKSMLQSQERVPVTTSVTQRKSGVGRNTVDKNVGTQLMLTMAKGPPDTVRMELSFEKTRLITDAKAPPLAEMATGEKVLATTVATLTIQTAVRVVRGQTTAVAGHSSDARHYVLLVSARAEN